ncbi:hypothetical protein BDN71DRAFT_1435419 [Pleurotus eryngii]|uniref:Zn(2)-C6 fungal-type domain-containing protein n=1 Tax=Pleurotus eryngii TaxID=5323 RepID=A0A9P6D206_PLEER|nr:hypothetical protein BDN71DRAFT_1435419 [Pleurotus eryngii]
MDVTNTLIPEIQKLRKGEACMYCRRRKMKCDGARPICSQCMRGDRAEDCEYAAISSYSRTQGLEDTIARVEARIRKLENPDNGQGANLVLRNPYFANEFQQLPSSDLPVSSHAAPNVQQAASSNRWWILDEPPMHMIGNLFLQSAVEVGFFLNTNRFRQSSLRDLPHGHHERPHPVLLSAAYLWGIHLTGEPYTQHEDAILTRALSQLTGSLSGTHPQRIMHTIQAKVLLIHYLYANGRLLEGKYHTSSVVGLAFAARLNKVRSSEVTDTNPLPAAVDWVEEGERIRACWTIFSLDKCWAVVFDSSPNTHCPAEMAGQQLDTPWPLEMVEYEQKGLLYEYEISNRTSYTLQNFLNEVPTSNSGDSALGFLAKGAILWELSTRIFHQFKDAPGQTLTMHIDTFKRLDRLIDQVIASIERTFLGRKEYILPRCIASAAAIRLHSGLANTNALSRGKCLLAAEAIVLSLNSIPDLDSAYANPIIASAWTAASQVISSEVTLWRSVVDTVGTHEVERAERDLKRIFNAGLNVMTVLAERSQLIRHQGELTRQSYIALFGL